MTGDDTPTLAGRVPGQAVITRLLDQQAARRRGPLARLIGRSPLSDDTRPAYVGALGEIEVGRALAQLPRGWDVRHAVPVGASGADLDHLVVGPAGVFAISTRHHAGKPVWVAGGTLMVAGQKKPYVRDAEHGAERARTALSAKAGFAVPVVPVLAMVGVQEVTVRQEPPSVRLLRDTRLLRWLVRQPEVLSPDQVAQVLAWADRPSTWQEQPVPEQDVGRLLTGFRSLHQQVRRARRVRTAWAVGTPLAATGGMLVWGEELVGLAQALV